jgi:hypothetical protein
LDFGKLGFGSGTSIFPKELDQKPKTGMGLGWILKNWGLEVELEFTGPKTGLLVPLVLIIKKLGSQFWFGSSSLK